ncbi:hypothetical protein D8674_005527 [Pyrus ussuriensis x Pyrus communis]|uniref:Uncharacterized protein n=1 Tax=Pyrus ussuriensis x Pyrus communis TaxID=2448454 RepID=A0A5N5FWQ2_9ROSA|nr:hypothetical protein D8674_005527 [Pyrus ussuriensis x Pyrus communis]
MIVSVKLCSFVCIIKELLSSLLSDLGLNIREAHVFSTTDGYSLDVLWWMDGWSVESLYLSLYVGLLRLSTLLITYPSLFPYQ